MSRFLVKADGADAPGIVAAVTGAIAERNFSIEDTSTTRLGGHFAILVVVVSAEAIDVATFRAAFEPAVEAFGLDVLVEELPSDVSDSSRIDGRLWAITLSGSDKPGVVSRFARYLAGMGANIEELSTRIVGARSGAYAVLMDVVVPAHIDGDRLVSELSEIAGELGVSCDAVPVEGH